MTDTQDSSASPAQPKLSFTVHRPAENGKWTPGIGPKLASKGSAKVHFETPTTTPPDLYPGGSRSLSGIALRAFLLGVNAALGLCLSVLLVHFENRLWRPAFFVGTLCIFHFLEFWTTARYNTSSANSGSFLLTNGSAYRQAHACAFLETAITSYFFAGWQARINPPWIVALGIAMILAGQVVRSLAMVQAGTNFNHQIQHRRNEGHELVTTGLYAYFRHPSYFGFFWWGLGTQVALGNSICLFGYAGVLWYFFKHRIRNEELYLVTFFGKDYEAYRARTPVWIPFI